MSTEILLEFIFSLKWLSIIVIILGYRLLRNFLTAYAIKNNVNADIAMRDNHYNEEEIIAHLDYIINEALDTYVILNIHPKDIYYINTKMEDEMRQYLSETVPDRISRTLYVQLAFIYNNNYIGTFIGQHIYMVVLNYVTNFNSVNANRTQTQ